MLFLFTKILFTLRSEQLSINKFVNNIKLEPIIWWLSRNSNRFFIPPQHIHYIFLHKIKLSVVAVPPSWLIQHFRCLTLRYEIHALSAVTSAEKFIVCLSLRSTTLSNFFFKIKLLLFLKWRNPFLQFVYLLFYYKFFE